MYTNLELATIPHVEIWWARRAAPLPWTLPDSAHRPAPPSERLQAGHPQFWWGQAPATLAQRWQLARDQGYGQLACEIVVNTPKSLEDGA